MHIKSVFKPVRKVGESYYYLFYVYLCVCPSVCPHGITWLPVDDFSENLYLGLSLKSVKKMQEVLKSDKNNMPYIA
jgi:hypothetical protein